MGSTVGNEAPVHTVALDGFWLDQTEVTIAQYREFAGATGYKTTAEQQGRSDIWARPEKLSNQAIDAHPVVHISWDDATAYCAWAGGRLPTEAEWEYAARGPEGLTYPWGNTFNGTLLNFCDQECSEDWADKKVSDGYPYTAPVGNYPGGASWVGALNLAGNVWEWVADWYGPYPSERQTNPTGPQSGDSRVLRGGSWYDAKQNVRSSSRNYYTPLDTDVNLGFRCAASRLVEE